MPEIADPGTSDIENKAAGMEPVYTDLKNPNFGEVARAMGLWGRQVERQVTSKTPCKPGSRSLARRYWM